MTKPLDALLMKPADAPEKSPDDLLKEIADLKAELASRPAPLPPDDVARLPRYECYVEVDGGRKSERGSRIGEKFDDPDDPRLQEIIESKRAFGASLVTNRLFYNEAGQVVRREQRHGRNSDALHMLRDMMRSWRANGCAFKNVREHAYDMPVAETAGVDQD